MSIKGLEITLIVFGSLLVLGCVIYLVYLITRSLPPAKKKIDPFEIPPYDETSL